MLARREMSNAPLDAIECQLVKSLGANSSAWVKTKSREREKRKETHSWML